MIYQADAARIPFADKTFHACVTSPPYWGLRKYSGKQGRIWGGDKDCVHEWGDILPKKGKVGHGQGASTLTGGRDSWENREGGTTGQFCKLCNAWYGSLGLEPTPQLHIQHIVEIFREVKRVLRDDGVVWLNYGDCYSSQPAGNKSPTGIRQTASSGMSGQLDAQLARTGARKNFSLPQGNLMLMPHRIAIALQDDGWIVRNDLIWFKRNPMPESCAGWRFESKNCKCGKDAVEERIAEKMAETGLDRAHIPGRDFETIADPDCVTCHGTGKVGNPILKKGSWRHTRAHEYVFQLVKGPKMKYWCNQEAVREALALPDAADGSRVFGGNVKHGANLQHGERTTGRRYEKAPSGRNPRSVLDVPTQSYSGAHYATFPPNLIAPLIRASCPRRACPECGQGWSPVVEKQFQAQEDVSLEKGIRGHDDQKEMDSSNEWQDFPRGTTHSNITNYRPTCECGHEEFVPGICLDPFIGSGTTGAVAKELQRRWVGLDISMEYLDEQAKVRALNWTPSKALEGLPLFEGRDHDLP